MEPFLDVLLQLAASAVLALGGYAIARLSTWLKLREDSEVRAYLNQALERGVDLALIEVKGRLPGYARLKDDDVQAAVERVAQYAQGAVPDALAHFSIDAPGLRERASARIAARISGPAPNAAG